MMAKKWNDDLQCYEVPGYVKLTDDEYDDYLNLVRSGCSHCLYFDGCEDAQPNGFPCENWEEYNAGRETF